MNNITNNIKRQFSSSLWSERNKIKSKAHSLWHQKIIFRAERNARNSHSPLFIIKMYKVFYLGIARAFLYALAQASMLWNLLLNEQRMKTEKLLNQTKGLSFVYLPSNSTKNIFLLDLCSLVSNTRRKFKCKFHKKMRIFFRLFMPSISTNITSKKCNLKRISSEYKGDLKDSFSLFMMDIGVALCSTTGTLWNFSLFFG